MSNPESTDQQFELTTAGTNPLSNPDEVTAHLQKVLGEEFFQRVKQNANIETIKSANDFRAICLCAVATQQKSDFDKLSQSDDWKNIYQETIQMAGNLFKNAKDPANRALFSNPEIKQAIMACNAVNERKSYLGAIKKEDNGISEINDFSRGAYASETYLGRILAYTNLSENAIIPIFNELGEEQQYEVKNIYNDRGFVMTALVPVDTEKNQDIKILFRGTHDLHSGLMDVDSTGAGSKVMRDNKVEMLNALNQIIEKSGIENPSLTITGHSLGAALAQRFTSEVHQYNAFFNPNENIDFNDEKSILSNLNGASQKGGQPIDDLTNADMAKKLASRYQEYQSEFANHQNLDAIKKISSMKLCAINPTLLSNKERIIADGAILINSAKPEPIEQQIRYLKGHGDLVSQTGLELIGISLINNENVSIEVLTRKSGLSMKELEGDLYRSIKDVTQDIKEFSDIEQGIKKLLNKNASLTDEIRSAITNLGGKIKDNFKDWTARLLAVGSFTAHRAHPLGMDYRADSRFDPPTFELYQNMKAAKLSNNIDQFNEAETPNLAKTLNSGNEVLMLAQNLIHMMPCAIVEPKSWLTNVITKSDIKPHKRNTFQPMFKQSQQSSQDPSSTILKEPSQSQDDKPNRLRR